MSSLHLKNISKTYDNNFNAIAGLSLDIDEGALVVVVGPSGCGKSTLLRLIAGLDPVSAGQIILGENDITHYPAGKRNVAMVFQSYALYPHLTVYENIAFPLQMQKMPKAQLKREVERAAAIVQLTGRLYDKPAKLSGGQRQRVAIARAIVRRPALFLLDEPLSNLDASLRLEMRSELLELHRQLATTMIYVTHDQSEAMTMADQIVLLNNGKIEQVGSPMALYHQPVSRFTAGFIGSPPMNFIAGTIEHSHLTVPTLRDGQFYIPARLLKSAADLNAAQPLWLGIRPEAFVLHPPVTSILSVMVPLVITLVERHGLHTIISAHIDGGQSTDRVTCLFSGDIAFFRGQTIPVFAPLNQIYLFDNNGINQKIEPLQENRQASSRSTH